MHISFSAIETFWQCPQKYKFQYIDRIKAPKSIEAIFGTLIHDVLKYFHSKNPLLPTLEEVLNYYKDNWPAQDKMHWKNQNEEISYFNQGVKILTDYYSKNKDLNTKILALESHFELPLKDSGEEHTLSGIIDRIDKLDEGIFEIIDYKTTKTMPSQENIDNNLQLSCYYLGIINRWPSMKDASVKLSLYFLKHGEKLTSTRTPEQLDKTKEKILLTIGEIKKSDFRPIPSSLCDWCGYKNTCPMWRHQFEKEYTDEEVKNAAKELFNLSDELKKTKQRFIELKTIINDYCDKNNFERVFTDDGYITRSLKIIYDYDVDKIKTILDSIKKWQEVLSFDKKKLTKIIKFLPPSLKTEIENTKVISKKIRSLSLKKIKNNTEANKFNKT